MIEKDGRRTQINPAAPFIYRYRKTQGKHNKMNFLWAGVFLVFRVWRKLGGLL
jgi:hypothetical protein